MARQGKSSAADAKQAWHDRSQLEMRRTRQRDELGVAVWKPDNRDDQAHPEKFLLHMYIGATVFAIYIFIYCHSSSTQLRLPTGSVLVWTNSLFDTYICVWYIYILPLYVYPTPLAYWECNCVDAVAFSIYIHFIWYVYMCLIYIYIATIRLPNSACLLGV